MKGAAVLKVAPAKASQAALRPRVDSAKVDLARADQECLRLLEVSVKAALNSVASKADPRVGLKVGQVCLLPPAVSARAARKDKPVPDRDSRVVRPR